MGHLHLISNIIGWVYTALWSFSNFPQIVLNYRRSSVAGWSVDFQALNTLGFTFYSLYVGFGMYFQHKWDLTRSIVLQDVLFAVICGTSVYILFFQTFIQYRRTMTGTIHVIYRFIMFGIVLIASYNVFLGINDKIPWFSKEETAYAYSVIQFLGYSKSFISLIKYIPQAYLNYQKKSVKIAVSNYVLDLLGGTCSFLQMFINGFAEPNPDGSPDFSHIFSNIPKLLLSLESVFFDIVIISQYFWYKKNTERLENETKRGYMMDDVPDYSNSVNDGNGQNYIRIM
jgi:cystinosin